MTIILNKEKKGRLKEGTQGCLGVVSSSRVPNTPLGSMLVSRALPLGLTKSLRKARTRHGAPEAGRPVLIANHVPHFPGSPVPQGWAGSSCCPLASFCQLFREDELMSKSLAFVKYKNTTKRSAFYSRPTDRRSTRLGVGSPSSSPNSAQMPL